MGLRTQGWTCKSPGCSVKWQVAVRHCRPSANLGIEFLLVF